MLNTRSRSYKKQVVVKMKNTVVEINSLDMLQSKLDAAEEQVRVN